MLVLLPGCYSFFYCWRLLYSVQWSVIGCAVQILISFHILSVKAIRKIFVANERPMVRAVRGVMLEIEPSIHEVLKQLNETNNFIIEDISDTVLFVKAEAASSLKEQVAKVMAQNMNIM